MNHRMSLVTYWVYFRHLDHFDSVLDGFVFCFFHFIKLQLKITIRAFQIKLFLKFHIKPFLNTFLMEKVLTSRYFNYLRSHLKVNHANNAFCQFEFILVLYLLIINHLIHGRINFHFLFFHFAWVALLLLSVLDTSFEQWAEGPDTNWDAHEEAEHNHEHASLIENSGVSNVIWAVTVRDSYFKRLVGLRKVISCVNLHFDLIFVLKQYPRKAFVAHSWRLP